MKIIKLTLALFLIIAFAAIQNNDANAGCRINESCSVADDTGPSPICESGTYDPCDSWMSWDVYFTRTEHQGLPYTTLICVIENSGWNRQYTSRWYNPNQSYHFEGTHYVGSSSNHKIVIYRSGATGNYIDISVQAVYFADTPD